MSANRPGDSGPRDEDVADALERLERRLVRGDLDTTDEMPAISPEEAGEILSRAVALTPPHGTRPAFASSATRVR